MKAGGNDLVDYLIIKAKKETNKGNLVVGQTIFNRAWGILYRTDSEIKRLTDETIQSINSEDAEAVIL